MTSELASEVQAAEQRQVGRLSPRISPSGPKGPVIVPVRVFRDEQVCARYLSSNGTGDALDPAKSHPYLQLAIRILPIIFGLHVILVDCYVSFPTAYTSFKTSVNPVSGQPQTSKMHKLFAVSLDQAFCALEAHL